MKLNYKRTILVGFAFFLITAFWQAYDNIIALTLTNKFGMPQAYSGIIMAFDNILALFMLPLFGALSDKCRSKMGKRTPFILVGTILAAVAFVALSFVDNMQLTNIQEVSSIDSTTSLEVLYDYDYGDTELKTTNGTVFKVTDFSREKFLSIRTDTKWDTNGNDVTAVADYKGTTISPYAEYVSPARQAFAWHRTIASPQTLIFFVGLLLVVLLAMSIFRSPAVALMPDVTPKPLRSKGNAVINLMGSAGGVIVLVLGMIFGTGAHASTQMVMEAMEETVTGGYRCLDLGSGSGILSIAALRLGAASAVGIDIDPIPGKSDDALDQDLVVVVEGDNVALLKIAPFQGEDDIPVLQTGGHGGAVDLQNGHYQHGYQNGHCRHADEGEQRAAQHPVVIGAVAFTPQLFFQLLYRGQRYRLPGLVLLHACRSFLV